MILILILGWLLLQLGAPTIIWVMYGLILIVRSITVIKELIKVIKEGIERIKKMKKDGNK